jgi:hypothetical protein
MSGESVAFVSGFKITTYHCNYMIKLMKSHKDVWEIGQIIHLRRRMRQTDR